MWERRQVTEVKERHKESILAKPNVLGVGTGYKTRNGKQLGDLCVIAMVSQKIPQAGLDPSALVPAEVDGISTDVIQVGFLRAQQERNDRWRPALGGVSLGHYKITAGTLGVVVRDRTTGTRLILSNNHVLANNNQGQQGDPILQPGAVDGGREEKDTFATLERFYPIRFNHGPVDCSAAETYVRFGNAMAKLLGSKHRVQAFWSDPQATNQVDAAIARPVNDREVLDEILEIGAISGILPAMLSMRVRKSGRTTGLTTGQIMVLDATVTIDYGDRSARFENQIVTTAMSQPGDSGSLLVAGESMQAVGLLFAGSDQATLHNPIQAVLDCLDVTL